MLKKKRWRSRSSARTIIFFHLQKPTANKPSWKCLFSLIVLWYIICMDLCDLHILVRSYIIRTRFFIVWLLFKACFCFFTKSGFNHCWKWKSPVKGPRSCWKPGQKRAPGQGRSCMEAPRRISSKSRGNHYLVLFICVVDPGAECIGPRRQKFLVSPLLDIIYTPTTFCIGHKLFVWEFCSDVSFHEVCTNIKAATHLILFYYLFGALGL